MGNIAGNINQNNVIQIGGPIGSTAQPGAVIPFVSASSVFVIGGGVGASTNGNYISLGYRGAQYQVTAGKTFQAFGFYLHSDAATGAQTFEIGYADTALIAVDTATAPTTPVSVWGPGTSVTNGMRLTTLTNWYSLPFRIPASKYAYFRVGAAMVVSMVVIGIEV